MYYISKPFCEHLLEDSYVPRKQMWIWHCIFLISGKRQICKQIFAAAQYFPTIKVWMSKNTEEQKFLSFYLDFFFFFTTEDVFPFSFLFLFISYFLLEYSCLSFFVLLLHLVGRKIKLVTEYNKYKWCSWVSAVSAIDA